MHIDKTIYDQSLTTTKDFYYKKDKAQVSPLVMVKAFFARMLTTLEGFVSTEASIVRIVIGTTSLACFIFGLMGTEQYHYQSINLTQSFCGFIILLLTFTRFGEANIRNLGNIFIYLLDISNATLVATSHFNDKLSYQYIIYFFVSSLFFNNKNSLLACIVLNTVFIFGISVVPHENSSEVSDFYIAFVASEFALMLLMVKRFNTEAKLAENEQKYRLLAENSADIICTHKPNGEFDFVSPSIASLTGYDPSELTGRSASRFVYPDDREVYNKKIANPDARAGSEVFQYRFLTKEGKYIWLETVVRGMGEYDSNGTSFLSQTRSFQRHREYLEQIEKQTTDLQESYKDLEMFAYISSHDMQEPLRMISNYMQLLRRKYESKLDPDAMEYIEYAVKGASNLQALIKDLLSYSTINKKGISFVPVDMDMLLDDVLSGLQLLMQERNVKVYINEPMRPLMADKNALTQLMQNLIQNGIKYNTSTSPVIRIFCTEDAKSITYCIQDNGIGIDQQYAVQIFEPFQRLHNKHNFPGTGLGLSICRKIIDRLNGKIWVESEPGVGSSFFFSIPKVQEVKEG
ncbi:MAG: sensor signal transduction histidine kinase [Bacteroidetes bacterium]|nr:sensor signal transduction histidine kinase [Bacteroidota bacterium]